MKNRILLACLPLLLASSLCYTANDTEQTQQEMNVFKSGMKTFQKKMNLYARCMKGKCSQSEKSQAKADLKKAAKVVIPTAIVLLTAGILYKRRLPILGRLSKLKGKDPKTPEKRKFDKLWFALQENKFKQFEAALKDKAKLDEEQLKNIAFQLVFEDKKNMFKKLVEKEPAIINIGLPEWTLLSWALFNNKQEITDLLLNQPDIDVHTNIHFRLMPLYIAAQQENTDLVKRILSKHYTTQELTDFLNKIPPQERIVMPEYPDFEKILSTETMQEKIIKRIKTAAQEIGIAIPQE